MVLNSLESCGSVMSREFDSLRFRQIKRVIKVYVAWVVNCE